MGPIHGVLHEFLHHQIFLCILHGVGIFYLDHPLLHTLQDFFLLLLLPLHLLPLFIFQPQFQWDLLDAYLIRYYCGQLPIVHPKSMPRYKYLSASGVRVFAKAVRFGLTFMSKIDGVRTLLVANCLSFCFLRSKACQLANRLLCATCCL